MLGPNLVTSQLASWAENAVKFKLKFSENWKRKPNKNEVGIEWETKFGEQSVNEIKWNPGIRDPIKIILLICMRCL